MACRTVSASVSRPAAPSLQRAANPRPIVHRAPLRISRPVSQSCKAAANVNAAATTEESLGSDTWNKSYYPTGKDAKNVTKQWYIIDAEGQTLGRLASLAATYIRGKNSASYTPSQDMGNYVIVINAEKVAVTGNKANQKTYFRHTQGRPGGWKVETFNELQKRIPERIVEKAVWGMLPKGRLGKEIFHHLKVFKGTEHPHAAQQPIDITGNIGAKAGRAR
mmetsp:Transcript_31600/g.56551  ORF Transcript_31600/g.56551 Transcript_31600/m.56551 type:complete len:221 (-) Transcript_31600:94-756(-)|eukprot:CAMPEP_0177771832 /NCGR_PEP_ID=MMETSP0491_2-20121128/11852_1 /TAXON_ID=63592 /ORGANISM="Tetraselmis chuii, Strain PLY429" /LENGTH=220 /DNA_ID=CAMNT_0019289507 /DNA_START=122 /DNA_END=784 /DNA_ORIENTATION=+